MKNRYVQIFFLLFLIVGTVYVVIDNKSASYRRMSGSVFGTVYNITYQSPDDLTEEIQAAMQDVDNTLSPFNKQSIITSVNENHQKPLNDMFIQVFNLAMNVSKQTSGAFDITVAPLVNAWGFGFKNGSLPDSVSVKELLSHIGYEKVAIIDGKVKKTDDAVMLDCSAIAKGYGCDAVAEVLRKNGVKNFMVEIGGEIVAKGVNSKKDEWRIGVTKPTDDSLSVNGDLQTVLSLSDCAMATSGNYRNFYYRDGKKYAHTIDPATGFPVQHSLLSATVVADDCATADAYATAFMVMGAEKAKKVLERHQELSAYFICAKANGEMEVWFSPSLRDKIKE